ncbi:hypothetical protein QBC40DRAFT_180315 [Triangularia verruculosa]|uniref:Uncharacterized protein n=1 Tax=Triangularia verruculosa TaxID=2587418 RepID=A0AAN7ASR2_9PEZI|nr:hypothetical protein QBC40DRAFT_180315 [Triangularia verruculosa]
MLITADQLLSGFDIPDKRSRSFLRRAIASGQSPPEAIKELQDIALTRDDEEATMALQHAYAISHQSKKTEKTRGLSKKQPAKHTSHFWDSDEDMNDAASTAGPVKTSSPLRLFAEFDKLANQLREELSGSRNPPATPAVDFARFDRLAQQLRDDLEKPKRAPVSGPPVPSRISRGKTPAVARQTAVPCPRMPDIGSGNGLPCHHDSRAHCCPALPPNDLPPSQNLVHHPPDLDSPPPPPPPHPELTAPPHPELTAPPRHHHRTIRPERAVKAASKTKTSPFFSTSPPQQAAQQGNSQEDQKGGPLIFPLASGRQSPRKRAPGTVSSLPIPPLTAPRFGLIQEELATSPFHLLVAVTFLIKTAGRTAIPVFRNLISRFPTPADLANEGNKMEVIDLIRPLGLAEHRYAIIVKFARGFLGDPPTKERRYGVRNYPVVGDGRDVTVGEVFGAEDNGNGNVVDMVTDRRERAVGQAWEIGHLTQGQYTLDSWRIFCRDVLLGRAEDWTGRGGGRGGGEGFQPEWMRVLPRDKELRACLRWMWYVLRFFFCLMREGWEWDPVTGDREPLREELRSAVAEGRVGYDDNGGLVILDS